MYVCLLNYVYVYVKLEVLEKKRLNNFYSTLFPLHLLVRSFKKNS